MVCRIQFVGGVSTLLLVAACGGGGSSGSSTPAAAPVMPEVTVAASAPVKSIVLLPDAPAPAIATAAAPTTAPVSVAPPSTYPAGGSNKVAFDLLNAERVRCGFGAVQQNAALDAASADSSVYFASRAAEGYFSASTYFHVQDPAKSGFTGVQPIDRAVARGYGGDFATDFAQDVIRAAKPVDVRSDAQLSAAQISDLLSTVYHLAGLLAPITETGIDFRRVMSSDGWDMSRTSILGGNIRGVGVPASTSVRSYPCEGVTQVNSGFRPARETPNPAPDLNDGTVGTPIYIEAPAGQALRLTGASVRSLDGDAPIALRTISAETDVYAASPIRRVAANQAFLLPLVRLKRGVRHQVQASGTQGGAAFSIDFSFTPSLE